MASSERWRRWIAWGLVVFALFVLVCVLAPAIEKHRRPSARYEVTLVNPGSQPISVTVVPSRGEPRRCMVPAASEVNCLIFEGGARAWLRDVSFWIVGFGDAPDSAAAVFLNGEGLTDTTRIVWADGAATVERIGSLLFERLDGEDP